MVVAFTGYRPEKMPFQESKKDERYLTFRAILSRVISRLIELGGTYFISGVARGFDTWVAEEILQRQKENKKTPLSASFRFRGKRIHGRKQIRSADIIFWPQQIRR